jgi:aminoglycoside 6'-N-acetyltransferase I
MIVRKLTAEDTNLLLNPAEGLFDYAVQPQLTAEFLNDPRHHLVAAIDGDQVVGFVSAVHYVHPDKATELWINEVAVAPSHRKRGIGRQMLDAMLAHGCTLGCTAAWVLTDCANAPAMRLYASAGGVENPTPAIMFEFSLT